MNQTPKTFIVILPFLYDGGVERVAANLINHLKNDPNFDCYLYLVNHKIERGDQFFDKDIDQNKIFLNFVQLIKLLISRKNIYVFSALTPANLFSAFLKIFFRFKLITSFQCSLIQGVAPYKLRLLPLVYTFLKWQSDALHVITRGVRQDLEQLIGANCKIMEIPNPTIHFQPAQRILRKIYPQKQKVVFVSLGRLHEQKGFDIVIRAMGKLKNKYSNFVYHIAGEGPQRKLLESLIKEHELQDYVFLEGFKDDFVSYYKDKDVYLFPSRFEGMGLALVEALSVGLPVIASDCNYGPSEILVGGQLGILIKDYENPEIWIETLEKILSSESYRWDISLEGHLDRYTNDFFLNSLISFVEKSLKP